MSELLPCPFCEGAVQFRKALWPSDGNVDAIIHASPTTCGMLEFSDGSTDESILARWNARNRPAQQQPGREQIAKVIAPELYGSPMAYPENIESDEDLNFYRNQALNQADTILALSSTNCGDSK